MDETSRGLIRALIRRPINERLDNCIRRQTLCISFFVKSINILSYN